MLHWIMYFDGVARGKAGFVIMVYHAWFTVDFAPTSVISGMQEDGIE